MAYDRDRRRRSRSRDRGSRDRDSRRSRDRGRSRSRDQGGRDPLRLRETQKEAAQEPPAPQTPAQRLGFVETRLAEARQKAQDALLVAPGHAELTQALARAATELHRAAELAAALLQREARRAAAAERLRQAVAAPAPEPLAAAIAEAEGCGVAPEALAAARAVLEAELQKQRVSAALREALAEAPEPVPRLRELLAEAERCGLAGHEAEEARAVVQRSDRRQRAAAELSRALAAAQAGGPAQEEAVLALRLSVGEAEAAHVPAEELSTPQAVLAGLLAEVEQRRHALHALREAAQRRDAAAIAAAVAEGERLGLPAAELQGARAIAAEVAAGLAPPPPPPPVGGEQTTGEQLLQQQSFQQLAAMQQRQHELDQHAQLQQAAAAAAVALGLSAGVQDPSAAVAAAAAAMAALVGPGGLATGIVMSGTVKRWDSVKGFGFVTPDSGSPDLFVHVKELEEGECLVPGSRVFFEAMADPRQNGKYRAKIKAGAQKREAAVPTLVSERLYCRGLPTEISDEELTAIFSQYGSVFSARKLPPVAGKPGAAALIRMVDVGQATWIVENVSGQIPVGLTAPIVVSYAEEKAPAQAQQPPPLAPQPLPVQAVAAAAKPPTPPSDKLYMVGLPLEITEEQISSVFGQYGQVMSVKKLPTLPGKPNSAAVVRMADVRQAKWLVDNVDKNIPLGLATPVSISFADTKVGGSPSGGAVMGGQPAQVAFFGTAPSLAGAVVAAATAPGTELLLDDVPAATTEETIAGIVGQYGSLVSVRKLPLLVGAQTASFVLRMSEAAQAKWLVDNLNRNIPVGLASPVGVRHFDSGVGAQQGLYGYVAQQPVQQAMQQHLQQPMQQGSPASPLPPPRAPPGATPCPRPPPPPPPPRPSPAGQPPATMAAAAPAAPPPAPAGPSNCLRIEGMPPGASPEAVRGVFDQYGTVSSVTMLPPGVAGTSALVYMAEVSHATWLVENLDKNVPVGFSAPVRIAYHAAAA